MKVYKLEKEQGNVIALHGVLIFTEGCAGFALDRGNIEYDQQKLVGWARKVMTTMQALATTQKAYIQKFENLGFKVERV